jgi:hypothetical protein
VLTNPAVNRPARSTSTVRRLNPSFACVHVATGALNRGAIDVI